MDVEIMNTISIIIKREKLTNNILFMLKDKIPELEKTALEHSKHLYTLIRLFSSTGFNMELEEPRFVNLTSEQIITMLLNDIAVYSDLLNKNDSNIITILSELIKIKISILNHLLFQEIA